MRYLPIIYYLSNLLETGADFLYIITIQPQTRERLPFQGEGKCFHTESLIRWNVEKYFRGRVGTQEIRYIYIISGFSFVLSLVGLSLIKTDSGRHFL